MTVGVRCRMRADRNPRAIAIELLDGLKAKVIAEGEAEAKAYKEFFEWCNDVVANEGFEIKTAVEGGLDGNHR